MRSTPSVSQPLPSDRRRTWRTLGALSFARIIDESEGGILTSLFPVIKSALNLSLSQLGILVAVGRFARMVFGPLWSYLADCYGRKKVLVLVTGAWGVWTGLTGLAQNFHQLLLLYSIGVIGTMAAEPISNSLLAAAFKQEQRGRAFGMLRFLTGFGPVLFAPLLAQFSRMEEGWRYGMFLMGFLSMLSGLFILLFVHEPTRSPDLKLEPLPERRAILAMVKVPSFQLLAGSLPFITLLVYFAYDVVFFVEVRGWSTADANILKSFFALGFMLSSLLGGFLGDVFEKRIPGKGRLLLMQIYLLGFSLLSYLVLQVDWGQGWPIYGWMFLFGLWGSIGFSGVVLPLVSSIAPPALLATAFGLLFSFLQGLLSALLSLLAGFLADKHGLEAVLFWLVTVPYAINAVYWSLFYFWYPADLARNQKASKV